MVNTRSSELKKRQPPTEPVPDKNVQLKKSKTVHVFFRDDDDEEKQEEEEDPTTSTTTSGSSYEGTSDEEEEENSSSDEEEENSGMKPIFDDCMEELIVSTQSNSELLKLKETLNECNKIILSREITLNEILEAPIPIDKKASFVERYMSFRNSNMVGTEDYIFERDKLKEALLVIIDQQKTNQDTFGSTSGSATKGISDDSQFHKKISELQTNPENKSMIHSRLDEYMDLIRGEEKSKIKRWITTATNLPFDKSLPISTQEENKKILFQFKTHLDEKLYGMEKVKERLLVFLNKKLTIGNSKGCCIALIGPPGHGKTEISRAIGQALNMPFCQVSCGGLSTSDYLMGHDYTYTGSREGEISRCMIQNGVKNGILFFDEFEKISNKKDIIASLLHITDFTQNHQFKDHYMPELKQDLSKTWFIFSMNSLPEDDALRDRLDFIYVDPYTTRDKQCITRDFIFKKYLKEYPTLQGITIPEEVCNYIVDTCTTELGIRGIERMVSVLLEKFFFYMNNKEHSYTYPWFLYLQKQTCPSITRELATLVFQDLKDQYQPKHMSMYL